jgi:hypothetical protein
MSNLKTYSYKITAYAQLNTAVSSRCVPLGTGCEKYLRGCTTNGKVRVKENGKEQATLSAEQLIVLAANWYILKSWSYFCLFIHSLFRSFVR